MPTYEEVGKRIKLEGAPRGADGKIRGKERSTISLAMFNTIDNSWKSTNGTDPEVVLSVTPRGVTMELLFAPVETGFEASQWRQGAGFSNVDFQNNINLGIELALTLWEKGEAAGVYINDKAVHKGEPRV